MHHSRATVATSMAAVIFALCAGAACGTTADAVDAGVVPDVDAACAVGGGAPPWLVLGTGGASFVELPNGTDMELIHGPQGGYHVWTTALLGLGVSPDGYILRYDVTRTDGTALGTLQVALLERRLTRACGGWFRGGDFVVLSIAGPADVAGTDVDVSVRVMQDTTEIASDTRRVHIVDTMP